MQSHLNFDVYLPCANVDPSFRDKFVSFQWEWEGIRPGNLAWDKHPVGKDTGKSWVHPSITFEHSPCEYRDRRVEEWERYRAVIHDSVFNYIDPITASSLDKWTRIGSLILYSSCDDSFYYTIQLYGCVVKSVSSPGLYTLDVRDVMAVHSDPVDINANTRQREPHIYIFDGLVSQEQQVYSENTGDFFSVFTEYADIFAKGSSPSLRMRPAPSPPSVKEVAPPPITRKPPDELLNDRFTDVGGDLRGPADDDRESFESSVNGIARYTGVYRINVGCNDGTYIDSSEEEDALSPSWLCTPNKYRRCPDGSLVLEGKNCRAEKKKFICPDGTVTFVPSDCKWVPCRDHTWAKYKFECWVECRNGEWKPKEEDCPLLCPDGLEWKKDYFECKKKCPGSPDEWEYNLENCKRPLRCPDGEWVERGRAFTCAKRCKENQNRWFPYDYECKVQCPDGSWVAPHDQQKKCKTKLCPDGIWEFEDGNCENHFIFLKLLIFLIVVYLIIVFISRMMSDDGSSSQHHHHHNKHTGSHRYGYTF
eukprot:Nk52_evm17s348 gene=Nk52_evmTU17s348